MTSLTNFTLAPGQYYLVQQAAGIGGSQALPTPDKIGTIAMSASSGKVALVTTTAALTVAAPASSSYEDLVGYGATAFEGASAAPVLSSTTAALRLNSGCTDSNNNGADFVAGPPAPRSSASPLGTCGGPVAQPIVPSCPASLAVATGAAIDFPLAATDADSIVNGVAFASGNVAGISLSGFSAATAVGGRASVQLSLGTGIAAGTYPVVVQFSNNDGQTASCTVNLSIAAPSPTYTPIYTIQGSGAASTLQGTRTTRGVVTKVNNNGYFIQDETGDNDPTTSDGIFVFSSTAQYVSPGHLVQITGTVSEFNTGAATNSVTAANPVTEFGSLTSTVFLGTGSITPTVISLPVASQGDLERYEGMLVTINSPLTASQNYFLGQFGQVTLSAGGRLIKPSNVYRPGTAQALALADQNARSTILLDDGSSVQNPNPTPYLAADNTLRAGDTLPTGITGVIDYGLATGSNGGIALYKIHPTVAPVFTRSNPRTAAPAAPGGNVKVASFNVLNFFTTFTDGKTAAGLTGQGCYLGGAVSNANCRGADSLAEFTRQRDKIVQAMKAIDADVFGLMEIQNDVPANADIAVQTLVDALNAAIGAPTYAIVPQPPTTGTDAIRVAMIYKPATLTRVGASLSDGSAINNRPPFAQTFSTAAGEKFSVVVNHMKSKSCSGASGADADQLDGQGCYNDRRKQQATALLAFIETIKTTSGDPDVLVIGDLNAYGREDPIDILTTGGLVDQISRYNSNDYSYVFDGEQGYIDHALATPSLSGQTPGTTHWHINADEPSALDYNLEFKQPACATCGPDYYTATPYRASDHDPVVIGLSLQPPLLAQTITFTAIADRALNSGSFFATATASSGLTVTFSGSTLSVCTVTQQGSVTLVGVGVCSVTANQPGNAGYLAAPSVTRSFTVTANSQSISFGALPSTPLSAGSVVLSATASSGLAVSFSSQALPVCTVVGSTVTLRATGTCTVVANQPGDATFAAAATVTQSFTVTGDIAGSGDVPLPPWALWVLGAGLTAPLVRRLRRVH